MISFLKKRKTKRLQWMTCVFDEVYHDLQVDLGLAVQKACENVTQPLKFLYPLDISIKEKIEAIARSYGASGVEYSEQVNSLSSF